MKKVILYTLFGILCVSTMSLADQAKNVILASNRGMQDLKGLYFEIPADNATSSFVKVIENPTPNNPKAMKSSIFFGEDKITFINKNGVLREFISEGSGTSTILTEEKEKPRIWKIPNPNELPKNEDDFIATFQIYQKGVVVNLKEDGKVLIFTLKQ